MKNTLLSLLFCFCVATLFLPYTLSATGENDQTDNTLENKDISPRNCDKSKTSELSIDTTVVKPAPLNTNQRSYPTTPTSPNDPFKHVLCFAAYKATHPYRFHKA